MENDIKKAVLSGILISLSGCVYLGCYAKGLSWAGALLFAVGLYTILEYGLNLFTGKVGYIAHQFSDRKHIKLTLLTLLFNLFTAFPVGMLVSFSLPDIAAAAKICYAGKLSAGHAAWFVGAVFCGVLMYIAVDCFKRGQRIGVFLAVPAFILGGFDHSIANMFYNGAALSDMTFTAENLLFIVTVIAGNALGGMIIPMFTRKW